MERCSSSTESRKLPSTPTNTHYSLLTKITSGFALCLQAVSRWPCGTALGGFWVVMLEVGSRAAPRCGVCQPLSPAGTCGHTALGPQCLPAREAETGQLHPGLLFPLFLPPLCRTCCPPHFFKCTCPVSVSLSPKTSSVFLWEMMFLGKQMC